MLARPDDYKKAIRNAITARDFKEKQKWTQEALRLMTDKYALLLVPCTYSDFGASHPYMRNHGWFATPNTCWWTPEDVWLDN